MDIFCKREDTLKQTFEENPKFKRNGKEINIQDYVQEFKDDCEIYTIIEKYGCIEKIPMETQIIEAQDTLANIKNLRDLKDAEIRANRMFDSLPITIKKEFGNSVQEFRNTGKKWLENKLTEIQNQMKQAEPETKATTEVKE